MADGNLLGNHDHHHYDDDDNCLDHYYDGDDHHGYRYDQDNDIVLNGDGIQNTVVQLIFKF